MTDSEDAKIRTKLDEMAFKGVAFLFPAVLGVGAWAFSLQTRLETIATRQEERGPRIAAMERQLSLLDNIARDPAPKPETRVAVDALRSDQKALSDRVDRLEDRVNNLHQFMLNSPFKPPVRKGEFPPFRPDTDNAG